MKDITVIKKHSIMHDTTAWSVGIEDIGDFHILINEQVNNEGVAQLITARCAELVAHQEHRIEDGLDREVLLCQEIESLTHDLSHQNLLVNAQEEKISRQKATILDYQAVVKKDASRVKQVMKVPNTPSGREMIALMRKYVQPGKKVVLRGRSPKLGYKPGAVSYPIADCNEIGIYIEEK